MTPGDLAVLAHGVGSREDLPLPFELAVAGAAVAVLVSFGAVAYLWRTPRLTGAAAGRALPRPVRRAVDSVITRFLARAVGLLVFGWVAAAALFGPDDALNPTADFVYVLLWIGLVPISLLFGPVLRYFSPLRALHWLLSRAFGLDPDAGLRALPPGVGLWPAAVGLAAFTWLELAAPDQASTATLLLFFAPYVAIHLVAALIFGSRWFAHGEAFEVYSTLLGHLSPFGRRDDGRLVVRDPFDGLATIPPVPGLVATVSVLLGSTLFDGFSGSTFWIDTVQAGAARPVLDNTVGVLVAIALIAATYRLGSPLVAETPRHQIAPAHVPGLFAHSLVPIAAGYVIAHYFSLLVFEGQRAIVLLGDPLGTGADLFGLSSHTIDYSIVSAGVIAGVQVGAVVVGHVLGVVAAHDRAVALFPPRSARIGQLPLLVLMVIYTVGAILVLFAP